MLSRTQTSVFTALLLLVFGPTAALAQQAAPNPPVFTPKWNNGVSIDSSDGEFKFQFGILVQNDGRFVVNDSSGSVTDTFVLRRVRPILQGRVLGAFEFRLMPDFGNGAATLFDAYFDTRFGNATRVRIGKDKTPFGLEQLQSDYAVIFPERALATSLVPNRDIGIELLGDAAGGHVSYAAAVLNGVADGANADVDVNDGKDVAGRFVIKAGGAGFALAATTGRQTGALPSFKSAAQQTFFSYASAATADGVHSRLTPGGFVYWSALGAFAEYVRSTQPVRRGTIRADVTNTAWEVTGVVILTGEKLSDRGVTPRRPFVPGNHQWGAWQLAARVGELTVDQKAFDSGFAAAGAARTARAIGVGLTWYANQYIKHVLTYERTVFDHGGAPREPENAIIFRLQLNLQPSL